MVISYVVDDKETLEMIEADINLQPVHGFFRVSSFPEEFSWSVSNGDEILADLHLTYEIVQRVKKYGKKVTVGGFPEYFPPKSSGGERNGTT